MITPQEFHPIFAMIEKAYPQWRPAAGTAEVYYLVVKDLDLDLVKAAVLDYLATDTPFAPSAGQIRGTAFRMVEEQQDRPTGTDAWGIVMREVRRCGWWGVPAFDNELIARAVEGVGGWRLLCATPEDMIHTTRARFIDAYNVLDKRAQHQIRMLPAVREVMARLAMDGKPQLEAGSNGHDNA